MSIFLCRFSHCYEYCRNDILNAVICDWKFKQNVLTLVRRDSGIFLLLLIKLPGTQN